jgi:hypothetical protein
MITSIDRQVANSTRRSVWGALADRGGTSEPAGSR